MRGWNLDPGRKRLDVSPVITGGQQAVVTRRSSLWSGLVMLL